MQPPADPRLYKYASARSLDRTLTGADTISLRCSLPREYNDPYELFLTIRYDTDPESLAYYADLVGEMVQFPTTCFSTRPDVTPMWAHYAESLRGAVLELDEVRLQEEFPESQFGDIEYRERADDRLNTLLEFARGTGKFRHSRALAAAILKAAYFTKSAAWAYERERRMVVRDEDVEERGGIRLLHVPARCVIAVISGPRASDETKALLVSTSGIAGCRYLEMRIGRSSPTPYFVDADGLPYVFDAGQITAAEIYCEQCSEPVASGESCSWCAMTDDMRYQAASSNPLRILEGVGLLDEYLESSRQIDARLRSRSEPPR